MGFYAFVGIRRYKDVQNAVLAIVLVVIFHKEDNYLPKRHFSFIFIKFCAFT